MSAERDACWPLVRRASRLGLATRIGLEDAATGPKDEPVRDNAHLVKLALREWQSAARAESEPLTTTAVTELELKTANLTVMPEKE